MAFYTEKMPRPPYAAGRYVLREGRNISMVAEVLKGVQLKGKSRKKSGPKQATNFIYIHAIPFFSGVITHRMIPEDVNAKRKYGLSLIFSEFREERSIGVYCKCSIYVKIISMC